MGCNDFRVGLEQVNQMRDLFSGDSPIVNRRRYRGHGCSDVVHAVDVWQLQIKWATAAFWQKAVETVLEAPNISLLRKSDHFPNERFGVAADQLFDHSGGMIFRSWGSPGIPGLKGTTTDFRPLLSHPRSGVTRSYWFH